LAELRLVTGFGDHQLHVGVRDVVPEVLAPAGVVQAGDGGTDEGGAAQGEDVVRCVVEQDADVRRAIRLQALAEEPGEGHRFGQQRGVRPVVIPEVQRRPVAVLGGVAAEERFDIRSGERDLGQWRREGRARGAGVAGLCRSWGAAFELCHDSPFGVGSLG
jgi:hypothetical protein